MVVVDAGGHPLKYDALTVMEDVVATQFSRIEIDVPGEGGRGWQRTGSFVDVASDGALNQQWRQDISQGAQHLREETYVRVSEPHYDAKVWPHVHPYGTGSMQPCDQLFGEIKRYLHKRYIQRIMEEAPK